MRKYVMTVFGVAVIATLMGAAISCTPLGKPAPTPTKPCPTNSSAYPMPTDQWGSGHNDRRKNIDTKCAGWEVKPVGGQ